jgi:hypothetical protein
MPPAGWGQHPRWGAVCDRLLRGPGSECIAPGMPVLLESQAEPDADASEDGCGVSCAFFGVILAGSVLDSLSA